MRDLALRSLAEFPLRLERCFAAFPASMRHWMPGSWDGIPSERLTAIEQVCHVRDIERDGYQVRIRRVLEEECPVLDDIPGEQLAIDRRYAVADVDDVLGDFRRARDTTMAMIAALSEEQLRRPAVFEGERTTLEGLIHFLCGHDHQHLAGLHWLLGKMTGVQR
jgi:hypothetical protein